MVRDEEPIRFKSRLMTLVWWHTYIPTLGKYMQENGKFRVINSKFKGQPELHVTLS